MIKQTNKNLQDVLWWTKSKNFPSTKGFIIPLLKLKNRVDGYVIQ